jgi:hypothetical protein
MFDLTPAYVRRGFIASGTELFMLEFTRSFFVYTNFVILHLAFLA